MRKLIIVAVASSTFGGVIGALATAATQSQASPAAIAAAVQRVQDQSADRTLTTISNKLATLGSTLSSIAAGPASGDGLAPFLRQAQQNIYATCVNTWDLALEAQGPTPQSCETQ